MSSVKDKIRKQIDYILASDKEEELHALSDILAKWQVKESGWGNTSEEEKEEIRKAFESMKDPANRISHSEMKLHLSTWRERLSGQKQ